MGNQYYRDTVNFVGTIAVLEGTDSSLSIRYRAGTITYNCGAPWLTVITPKLNAGGILQYPSFLTCSNHASFEGGFDRKDTLDVKIGDGGLGSQGGHIIRGVRIL